MVRSDWIAFEHVQEYTEGRLAIGDPLLREGLPPQTLKLNVTVLDKAVVDLAGYKSLNIHCGLTDDDILVPANHKVTIDPKGTWQDIRCPALNATDTRNGELQIACGTNLNLLDTNPHKRADNLDKYISRAAIKASLYHNVDAVTKDRERDKNNQNRLVDGLALSGLTMAITTSSYALLN